MNRELKQGIAKERERGGNELYNFIYRSCYNGRYWIYQSSRINSCWRLSFNVDSFIFSITQPGPGFAPALNPSQKSFQIKFLPRIEGKASFPGNLISSLSHGIG